MSHLINFMMPSPMALAGFSRNGISYLCIPHILSPLSHNHRGTSECVQPHEDLILLHPKGGCTYCNQTSYEKLSSCRFASHQFEVFILEYIISPFIWHDVCNGDSCKGVAPCGNLIILYLIIIITILMIVELCNLLVTIDKFIKSFLMYEKSHSVKPDSAHSTPLNLFSFFATK